MPPLPPRISRFLRQHHVLTLCTSSESGSWCAHVFYAWMPAENALVFTSGPETRHGREMLANPRVSGGIVLETKVVGKIRGVQVSGVAQRIGEEENGRRGEMENSCSPVPLFAYSPVQIQQKASAFKKAYLKRFPFALAAKLDLWVLQLEYVKMTDNRLGFGKKIEWRRGEEEKGRKGE